MTRRECPRASVRLAGRERIEKRLAPPVHILAAHALQQLLVAPLALGQRHLQRQLDAFGRAVGVVGVDQQRLLSCSAAPAKRDSTSTPGSSGSCAATYSLATRFMPSRSGVTSADVGHAIEAGQASSRDVAVDVAHRHPVELAEVAVDRAAQALELVAQVGVGVERLARGARRSASRSRCAGSPGSASAARETRAAAAAGPWNSRAGRRQQQAAPDDCRACVDDVTRLPRPTGQRSEFVDVDADGKGLRRTRPPEGAELVRRRAPRAPTSWPT